MAELITLREFSNIFNIKKPTVNARLKRLEKINPDKNLTIRKDNVIYLTENGRELLEKSFKDSPVNQTKRKVKRGNNEPVKDKSDSGELLRLYQEKAKLLENDLKASRRENERLVNQVEKLIAINAELSGAIGGALKDSQRLLNQEQSLALIDKTSVTPDKPKEKKSILARLAIAGRVLKGDYD